MSTGKYILKDRKPIPCPDLLEWARFFETADRQVCDSMIGDIRVSTTFLGIDHSFDDHQPPLLFETMIFGGPHDGYQERYSTWDDAEIGHAGAVDLVKGEAE